MIHQKKIKVGVTIFTFFLFAKIYSVNSSALSYKEVIIMTQKAEQSTTEKLALSDDTTTIIEEGTTSYFTTEYTPLENSTKNNEDQTTLSVTTELSMTTEEQLHEQSTIISMTEETTQCSQGSTLTALETGNEAPELLVSTDTPVTENITTYDENEKSTTLSSDVEDITASYEISTVKQDKIEEETKSVFNDNLMKNNNEKKWIDDEIVLPVVDGKQQSSSTNILVENEMIKGKNISLFDLILPKNQQMEKECQSTTMINVTEKEEISSTDKPATSTPEDIENYY